MTETAGKALRVLIADDEPPARRRLLDGLRDVRGVEVVGQVGSGVEAVTAIRRRRPDVVLLDVQMPGISGLEVVRRIGADEMPAVIFVTAYDRYALHAFDLAAVDYLLKPFDDERLHRALDRVREQIALRQSGALNARLQDLIRRLETQRGHEHGPAEGYIRRLAVDQRDGKRVLAVEEIDYIDARGPYAQVHAAGSRFLVRERMHVLESRLDPRRFCRIHRSTVVNLDRVAAVRPHFGGRVVVRLTAGEELKVSRSRRDELERRIGLRL